MKCITFQPFSFNHLFFLLYFIVGFTRKRIQHFLFGDVVQISGFYYQMYINILSYLLNIIPFLVIKYRSKSKINNNEEDLATKNNSSIEFIYTDKKVIAAQKGHLLKNTFLVSIFDFCATLFINIFYFFNDKNEVIYKYSLRIYLIYNTNMQYIVSYFLLKTYFYKHHYLSFAINFICILIFIGFDIYEIIDDKIIDYQYYILIFLRIFRLTCFSFSNNYAKLSLYSEFLSTYSLLLYMAIYETFFLIIFSIPFIFLKMNDLYVQNDSVFLGFLEYMKGINLLYSFCDLL